MVQLVPMNEDEFQSYLQYAIAEYGEGHVKSGGWKAEEALERATEEYRTLLPDGLATKDQYLYALKDEGPQVGMLWFAVRTNQGPGAFVYDIRVYEQFQRRGYASQAFLAMEEKVRELGLSKITLHVFGYNHGARDMYRKLGYIETNVIMAKTLETSTN